MAHELYSEHLFALSKLSKYNEDDDFAIVVQPFLLQTKIPMLNGKADLTYLAPDCFHLSGK